MTFGQLTKFKEGGRISSVHAEVDTSSALIQSHMEILECLKRNSGGMLVVLNVLKIVTGSIICAFC